ncbi:exopolysaccharide biosynthesis polyprenyl glycosylphosphotransferase [bacterium]|nr:exopolysaccharide biosynthesis polyprenyl glycosylphosphotransferase [bacterium]
MSPTAPRWPKFSIIVPVYNGEATIAECLEALASQDVPHHEFEVIIVDDGSTDDTSRIVERFDVRYIYQSNRGPAVARNNGVAHARGEIILFTDADCVPEPNWLREMVNPLVQDHDVAAVKGAYRTRQKSFTAVFAQAEFEERFKRLARRRYIDFVDTYSAAFRKEVFEAVGGFNPRYPKANNEDVELSFLVAQRKHKMVFNPRAIVYHTHPDTVLKYAKLKFGRAYWRTFVYDRFPRKVVRDSYTPQTLKIQILVAFYLIGALLGSALFQEFSAWLLFLGAAVFVLLSLPFAVATFKGNKLLGLLSPIFLFIRSSAFGFGLLAGLASQKKRKLLFPTIQMASDIVVCNISLVFLYWLRSNIGEVLDFSGLGDLAGYFRPGLLPQSVYLMALPVVTVAWLAVFGSFGLYHQARGTFKPYQLVKVFLAVSQLTIIIMAALYFFRIEYSRSIVPLFWAVSLVLASVVRSLIYALQAFLLGKGYDRLRAIVVGTGESARLVGHKLHSVPKLGYDVVGFVDDSPLESLKWKEMGGREVSLPVLGSISKLESLIEEHRADEIYISKPGLSHNEVLNLIARCESANVGFHVVSDAFIIMTGKVDMDSVGDLPLIDLGPGQTSALYLSAKAAMDRTLSLLFVILTLPLTAIISVAIKIESKGPTILRFERLGLRERPFLLHRFRTFHLPEPSKLEGRPVPLSVQYTKVGRFLERFHLDELPQLINVLRGEMSLVGPRPEIPLIAKKYEPWQRRRFDAKPGLTGLWQLVGSDIVPLYKNMEYDFYYVRNRSLLLDLSILIRTLPSIFLSRKPRR